VIGIDVEGGCPTPPREFIGGSGPGSEATNRNFRSFPLHKSPPGSVG